MYQRPVTISKSKSRCLTSQEPSESSKVQSQDIKDIDVLCTLKIKIESKNLAHGCIKGQWPYRSHDQHAKPQSITSSFLQSPKWRLKGHGCFCTFKIKIEGQYLDHGHLKDQWPHPNKIKMPNPGQEPPASSTATNQDFTDMYVGCTLKIKIERQNVEN